MKIKRILAMLLTVIMLAGSLASCGDNEDPPPSTELLAVELLNAGYKLIAPEKSDTATNAAYALIADAITQITGQIMDGQDDWVKKNNPIPAGNKEILIGHTNRAASEAVLESLRTNRGNCSNDWRILIQNNEVVITAGSTEALGAAAEAFVQLLSQPAGTMLEFYDSGIQQHAWEIVELGGVSLGEYVIVLPAGADKTLQTAANDLQSAILTASGFKLEILTDAQSAKAHELVLGKTSRPISTQAMQNLNASRPNHALDGIMLANGGAVALSGGTSAITAQTVAHFVNTYLKPDTQASVATLNQTFEKAGITNLKINGTNAGEYTIVYKEGADFNIMSVAYQLQAFLLEKCGYDVKIITDKTQASGKEILLGQTNRPSSASMDLTQYSVAVDASGNLVFNAGHYMGLQNGVDNLTAALSAQTGDTWAVASNYNSAGTVTNVALTWANNPAYTLVWNDEFNTGTSMDVEKWTLKENVDLSPYGVYNSTDSDVCYVDNNGNLVIAAVKTGTNTYKTPYSVTTSDTMNFSGGYLEMRGKVPFKAHGEWPGFWSTGGSNSTLFNKAYTIPNGVTSVKPGATTAREVNGYGIEIDFFEVFSSTNTLACNIHRWYSSYVQTMYKRQNGKEVGDDSIHLDSGSNGKTSGTSGKKEYKFSSSALANQYHTYGFLWTSEKMEFLVDGSVYYTYNLTNHADSSFIETLVSKGGGENLTLDLEGFKPDRIALNVILGLHVFTDSYTAKATWYKGKEVKIYSQFPINFAVDYVRLYQTAGDVLYLPGEYGNGVEMYTNRSMTVQKIVQA